MAKNNSFADMTDFQVSSVLTLYVVKILHYPKQGLSNSMKNKEENKRAKIEYFKMDFDCSKCDDNDEDDDEPDTSLREFWQKVYDILHIGTEHVNRSGNFKIYDKCGIHINESDLHFLN